MGRSDGKRQSSKAGLVLWAVAATLLSGDASAYGIVGHLRVVENEWDVIMDSKINRKNLRHQFAAWAGAIISDIGYMMPNDHNRRFTALAHYARSGDLAEAFLDAALKEPSYSGDPAYLAFARGFQSHYWADRLGHHSATNVIAAKVSEQNRKRKPPLLNLSYERDPETHLRVEARLTAFDVIPKIGRFTINRFAVAVLEFKDQTKWMEDFVNAVLARRGADPLLRFPEKVLAQYFRGAAIFACSAVAQHILEFKRRTEKEFLEKGRSEEEDLTACNLVLQSPDGVAKSPALNQLIAMVAKPLDVDERWAEGIYDESRNHVAEKIKTNRNARLLNFNLDTNVPSVAGQYRCADLAFQNLTRPRLEDKGTDQRPCTLREIGRSVDYQSCGAWIRDTFSERVAVVGKRSSSFFSEEARVVIREWLFDLVPIGHSASDLKTDTKCEASSISYRLGGPLFQVDLVNKTLCVDSEPRLVELLFGLSAAHAILDASKDGQRANIAVARQLAERSASHYEEAIERLRLGPREKVDVSAGTLRGLYVEKHCD